MAIINLTGHDIYIYNENDCAINERGQLMLPDRNIRPITIIKPQGIIRAKTKQKTVGSVVVTPTHKCNISIVTYGEPFGEPQDYNPDDNSNFYIVSVLAAKSMNQKYKCNLQNLLIVNNTVRNSEGQIIGCTGFARVY